MYCTKCGKEVSDDDLYCGNCGAKLTKNGAKSQNPVTISDEQQGLMAASERTFSNTVAVIFVLAFVITMFLAVFKIEDVGTATHMTYTFSIIHGDGGTGVVKYTWPCFMFVLGGLSLLLSGFVYGRVMDRIKIYQLNKIPSNKNRLITLIVVATVFLGLSIFLFIYSKNVVGNDLLISIYSGYTFSYGGGAIAMLVCLPVFGALYIFASAYESLIKKDKKNAKVKR